MNNKLVLKKQTKELMEVPADKTTAADQSFFNRAQLERLFRATPEEFIHKRAVGGVELQYVTGGYVRRELDIIFGFNWDFYIMEVDVLVDDITVTGKLVCRTPQGTVTKMQIGGAKIKYHSKKENGKKVPDKTRMLSYANDKKAAATDALKKCAAELGIARDIYYAEEFMEARIVDAEVVEAEKTAKEEAQEQQLIEESTAPVSEKEKTEIMATLNKMGVNDRMRVIKQATNKISLPKPELVTEGQWREIKSLLTKKKGSIKNDTTNNI